MSQYRVGKIMNWFFHVRFPSRLYDWHFGWLLDSRLCRLTHIGRKSGKSYRTVLEVAGTNPARHELMVMSGLGPTSNWYRNLHANGAAEIEIGRRRFSARYRELDVDEAAQILAAYEHRYRFITPIVRYLLSKLVGWRYDGSNAARRQLLTELPMVAFAPTESSTR
jgi:deazaflavin-dependent oxidoreductase (nitroreductase family)